MGQKHKTFLSHKKQINAGLCHIPILKDPAFYILIFVKLSFRFNEIPIKIQVGLYVHLSVCMCIWEGEKERILKFFLIYKYIYMKIERNRYR